MRDERAKLVEGLIRGAHSAGGWCKNGATRSLTVSSEAVIALCDYYAQAPTEPTATEAELLSGIDDKLRMAEAFLIETVKERNKGGSNFDPPNCTLALAAYLRLRNHTRERGAEPETVDTDFITICASRALETNNWLENKPGAIWACGKAFEIISEHLQDPTDHELFGALRKTEITTFGERLQQHILRLFQSDFVQERQLYGASVSLDLTFGVRKWAAALSETDVKLARSKSITALLGSVAAAEDALALSLSSFYLGSGDDVSYQVVAPAALVSGVDRLLSSDPLPNDHLDTWRAILYTIADEMDKIDPASAPSYVTAHHLRALTTSQLAAREVALIRTMMRDKVRRKQVDGYLQSQSDLNTLLVRYGNPGDRGFFAASNAVFLVFTGLLYALVLTSLFAAPVGSVASIASALAVALVLTPLSLVIWARKEKLHEKPPSERVLSIFQFFVAGGWIAIPIFIAYILAWFKNVANATFGH